MRSGSRMVYVVLGGLVAAPLAKADAPTSFSGQWSASALTASWSIGDWGGACGPKPSGGGESAGTVSITQAGGELVISGAGRPFTTASCWEPLHGNTRTSHTAGARSWRSTCRSPSGDPRQSSLVTTVTASNDDQLVFDETGQYQFVIKGQNCTASVRRTRYFRRVQATADTTPLLPPQPTAAARPTPLQTQPPVPVPKAVSPVCAVPGPPARIEVRPSHKLIRAGETFSFEASVVDARGCRLGIAPSFRLEQAVPNVSISANGKVSIEEGAAEGKVPVVAAVGARSVSVTLDIVARDRYEALLAQGGFDPTGASTDAAVARLESGSVGARSTVVEDDSSGRRTVFVGIVGAAALGLGLVGLLLVRRSRKNAREQAAEPSLVPAGSPPRHAPGMVCPTCREEYPAREIFCAKDGNRLVPLERGTAVGPTGSVCPICGQGYDPGISVCPKHDEPLVPAVVYAGRAATSETKKICPVCGAQFTGDSQFCGSCGAALVPVN